MWWTLLTSKLPDDHSYRPSTCLSPSPLIHSPPPPPLIHSSYCKVTCCVPQQCCCVNSLHTTKPCLRLKLNSCSTEHDLVCSLQCILLHWLQAGMLLILGDGSKQCGYNPPLVCSVRVCLSRAHGHLRVVCLGKPWCQAGPMGDKPADVSFILQTWMYTTCFMFGHQQNSKQKPFL